MCIYIRGVEEREKRRERRLQLNKDGRKLDLAEKKNRINKPSLRSRAPALSSLFLSPSAGFSSPSHARSRAI